MCQKLSSFDSGTALDEDFNLHHFFFLKIFKKEKNKISMIKYAVTQKV